MIKVKIDPGHGGSDKANRGPTGYVEADGVLKLSLMLEKELLSTGAFSVQLTRQNDTTLSLTERGKMGAGADLFISEHTNACDKKQRGTEVYYSVDLPHDKQFAQNLSTAVASALGIPNRGAKTRESLKYPGEDYYTVIDTAQDYGAKNVLLIESAFHDNAADEQLLKSEASLFKIAKAQASIICNWFNIVYPVPINKPQISPAKYYKYTGAKDISKLPVIRLNSVGNIVHAVQEELNLAGFNCGDVTGEFDVKTQKAVKAYQQFCGLTADGIIGPKTWEALLSVHVVELNLSEVKAALVSTSGPGISKSYQNFINANFFSGNKTIGWLISEGKILNRRDEYKTWHGNPKGTLLIYKDGRVEIGSMLDIEVASLADSGKILFCCQGFNLFPINLTAEGWGDDVARTCNSVSIGYNKTTKKIVIAVRNATNAVRTAKTMRDLGCDEAIRLDSGMSANLFINGESIFKTNRALTNIIHW